VVLYSTGVAGFDAAARAAESARQVAYAAAGGSQALIRAADIQWLQSIVAAGVQFNVTTPNEVSALAAINGPTKNV
jgi:hypothetical protein